jgi:hypothetical protein
MGEWGDMTRVGWGSMVGWWGIEGSGVRRVHGGRVEGEEVSKPTEKIGSVERGKGK